MDVLLGRITSQAVNYAIRSGVAITSTYAIKQCARLVKSAPRSSEREELLKLQIRLESKIRIISPAIDMIELIAARGNTSLESAVSLTKDIRWEIQALGVHLAKAASEEELLRRGSKRAKSREQNELELKLVIADVKRLLDRIEDAVPLINLAITTSGVNLSTNLPATVSPSRLLQASTFLTAADSIYSTNTKNFVQVGPAYTLSMYMLFAGHANRPHDEESIRETTWKEVIHKARVKLVRVPLNKLYHLQSDGSSPNIVADANFPEAFPQDTTSLEFAYQLMFVEDLDDGRVHTFEENEPQPGPFEDVPLAGIRDVVPIHQVSKIFYADTGKILNIGNEGETNSPILLLKRDVHAEPPRRMMERQESVDPPDEQETTNGLSGDQEGDYSEAESDTTIDHPDDARSVSSYNDQAELDEQLFRESTPTTPAMEQEDPSHNVDTFSSLWRLPIDLDPEWMALEVYTEDPDTDDEDDSEAPTSRPRSTRDESVGPGISNAFSNLNISSPLPNPHNQASTQQNLALAPNGPVKTSLSLLEMLIRLTALQQFRQASHLTIEDELLNFFLEDSATTGAGPDVEYRQRIRRDARRRVGFDPYDESPIKRRGEEYLAHPRAATETWDEHVYEVGHGEGSYRESSYFDGEGRYASPAYVRESIEYPRYGSPGRSPMPSSPSPHLRPPMTSAKSSPAAIHAPTRGQSISTPPPPVSKGRSMVLRGQRGRTSLRPRSALTKVVQPRTGDSALGTSPSEHEGDEQE
ncbi:RanGTP-binding protein-domain-containing protein [Delphinella strobiligena]|nr:RanGTP-binding protein-domain-containing protein [Delphinella strobiligena]